MSLWEKTLDIISKEMKQTVFDTWIRPIRSLDHDDSSIVLEVNNSFQQQFIEKTYGNDIKKALKQITNKDISLLFKIVEKSVATPVAEQEISDTAGFVKARSNVRIRKKQYYEKFNFDGFVVGDSNRLAFAACLAVAKNPGKQYNPLFLFGKRGVGKTHLLHSVGNYISQNDPGITTKYATIDEFSTDYNASLQTRDWTDFYAKFKDIDVLLFDDINLFSGKERFQDTFLQFFNYLFLAGKQIILTSDRPPKEIAAMQPRLINRFEQGLMTEIFSPDLETRQTILRRIAEKENFSIESKYIGYIASKLTQDIRELEGTMNRLILECRTFNLPVSSGMIDNILEIFIDKRKQGGISLDKIIEKISKVYVIDPLLLKDKRKNSSILLPRQIAMYSAIELTNMKVTDIAREFNKSHSIVIHSHKRIKEEMINNITVKNNVDKIISDLKDGF